MERLYNITQTAQLLGVAVKTLQIWDKEGKFVAQRTPTNRRVYLESQIKAFREARNRKETASDEQ